MKLPRFLRIGRRAPQQGYPFAYATLPLRTFEDRGKLVATANVDDADVAVRLIAAIRAEPDIAMRKLMLAKLRTRYMHGNDPGHDCDDLAHKLLDSQFQNGLDNWVITAAAPHAEDSRASSLAKGQKRIASPCSIHHSAELRNAAQVRIGQCTIIKAGVILNGRSNGRTFGIDLGPETYIKENCYIDAYGGHVVFEGRTAVGQGVTLHGNGGITIGRYCMIAGDAKLIAGNHRIESVELPYLLQGGTARGIMIGENVWIGVGSTILDGVTVGSNSVVAAGSILHRSLPPNSMYFGSPQRFEVRQLEHVRGLYPFGDI